MKKLFIPIILYVIIIGAILIKTNQIKIEVVNGPTNQEETKIDEYINNGLQLSDQNLSNANGIEKEFYYRQLNDTARIIYNELISEKEKLKTGTATINFAENTFEDILSNENGIEELSEEYQNAVDALRYDHMDLFYIDFTKTALKTTTYTQGEEKRYEVNFGPIDGQTNYFQEGITSKEDIDIKLKQINDETFEILKNATGSNYQKIYYIHNWIIDNTEYDRTYEENNIRDIYGTLINKKVVCEGYAKTFKYLLDELNIPCIIVSGEAQNSDGVRERHMWNYVQINEKWYAVDVTWDDPILLNSTVLSDELRYKYFCQGTNINTNHFINEQITEGCQKWKYPQLYYKE